MIQTKPKRIRVLDEAGQSSMRLNVFPNARLDTLVGKAVRGLNRPQHDTEGRPISYRARLERTEELLDEGVDLFETLQDDESVRLMEEITPG